jgi:hypothetical protein
MIVGSNPTGGTFLFKEANRMKQDPRGRLSQWDARVASPLYGPLVVVGILVAAVGGWWFPGIAIVVIAHIIEINAHAGSLKTKGILVVVMIVATFVIWKDPSIAGSFITWLGNFANAHVK